MGLLSTSFGSGNLVSGYFGDFLDITGVNAAEAAEKAANVQLKAIQDAVGETRAAREQTREDLGVFRKSGGSVLPGLADLVRDPNMQRDFISNNPLFLVHINL